MFNVGDKVIINGHENKGTVTVLEIPGQGNRRKKHLVETADGNHRYTVWDHQLRTEGEEKPATYTTQFKRGDTVIMLNKNGSVKGDKVYVVTRVNEKRYTLVEIGSNNGFYCPASLMRKVTLKSLTYTTD